MIIGDCSMIVEMAPHEMLHKFCSGPVEKFFPGPSLHKPSLVEKCDPVAELESLGKIVGDKQCRLFDL